MNFVRDTFVFLSEAISFGHNHLQKVFKIQHLIFSTLNNWVQLNFYRGIIIVKTGS